MTAGMEMLERPASGPSLSTKTVITEKCHAEVETDLCSLIPALREKAVVGIGCHILSNI